MMSSKQELRYSLELQLPVPWGHVAAKAWGSSKGKPVLMVHGTLDNAGSFDRLISLLPEEYYFICIDLPGHGYSSHFPSGVPLEFFNYVHTIHLILDQLQWKICTYIGHSLGAQLGAFFSILYPERLNKLIILDPLVSHYSSHTDTILRLREIYEVANKVHTNNISPVYTKEDILHALQYMRLSTLNTEAANALFTRAVTKVDNGYKYNRDPRVKIYIRPLMTAQEYVKFIKKISIPVLILVASASVDTHNSNKSLETLDFMKNKKAISIIFVEGNHDVHNNHPEKVASHICEYLRSSLESKL